MAAFCAALSVAGELHPFIFISHEIYDRDEIKAQTFRFNDRIGLTLGLESFDLGFLV